MKTSKNLATSIVCKNIVKQFITIVLLKFRGKMEKKWFDSDLLSKDGTFREREKCLMGRDNYFCKQ